MVALKQALTVVLCSQLAKILGTDLLQMAASFLPESERSHSRDDIVKDLQELAVSCVSYFVETKTYC